MGRFACLCILGWLLITVGCAGTQAWERGYLAERKMQLNDDPEATLLEQHVYSYREGSAGGYGSSGGGCGCN